MLNTSMVASQTLKKLKPLLTKSFPSHQISKNPKPQTKTLKKPTKKNPPKPLYTHEKITQIYNLLKYKTWETAQTHLKTLNPKWDSYTITQVLKTHPPLQKAWLFFNFASTLKNFKHDQYTYTTMLDIFGEAGRVSSMMFLFEQMREKKVRVDVVTYTCVMHWLSKSGDVDRAVSVWEEMRGNGCLPTVVSYTAYMKVLFGNGRVEEGCEVYKEMVGVGLKPNCFTYTVLMEHLASSGKFNEALEIFDKMQEASVQPDKAACNILIEIFCKTGEIWAILRILQYMKENFLVLRYPIYLKALESFKLAEEDDMLLRQVNRHFSDENSDIIEKYEEIPHDDNFIIDNGLILNLMDKKNLIAVDNLIAGMMDKGVRLESKVISRIIEVNSSCRRQKGALLAYEYSVKLGVNIEKTAYLALIGLSIRLNSFQKAVEIVEEMIKQGVSLGTHLNSVLIYRLGCNKDPVSAAKVFDLLPDEEKGTAEYTALIGAYFSCGNADKGLEVFEVMKSKGVNVALGTYCVLVDGLEKCRKARELEYYRKEKKTLQGELRSQRASSSMDETICNLLFARDFVTLSNIL